MERKTERQSPQPVTYRLSKYDDAYGMNKDEAERPPATTPGEWFSRKFPEKAFKYGAPLLEIVQTTQSHDSHVIPEALNEDFFASILTDERLGHHVIYYLPEHQFYFFDCRFDYYVPTSEEKLKLLLSQYLIQCAEEMPIGVNIQRLFLDLRSDENLQQIVKKARSLLAAGGSFFSLESGNMRIEGPEFYGQVAKMFTREKLTLNPAATMTITECYESFSRFCEDRKMQPMERRDFRSLMGDIIKEEFGLSLRHDLLGKNMKQQQGWKGLSARQEIKPENARKSSMEATDAQAPPKHFKLTE